MERKRRHEHVEEPNKVHRTGSRRDAASGAHLVAQHYNQRPNEGVAKRKQSRIIRLRSFNNWVKSVLIGQHARSHQTILDMGCGKGGDLTKWVKARVRHLVAADIASVSLEHMKERYESLRSKPFTAEFHALDCYQERLSPRLRPDQRFDGVSMQFCMHYAFENEAKARMMLDNVAGRLKTGGWFIGTIPDANWIVKRVRQEPRGSFAFGNDIYSIDFEKSISDTNEDPCGKEGFRRFGCRYMFHLMDAVDCPEFLVHWPTFERLADEAGLVLTMKQPFHEFYDTWSKDRHFSSLLERIGVIGGSEPEMSPEEWEAAGLYLAFAFRKK